ncbi:hypothetical protein HD554DRAFT_2116999 [Boletus coccyginus]|nr:hypothetical protein HD554DRAFT_2116999 [Boletus coccyginus]
MFAKFSTLALALSLPLVSALTVNPPTDPTTGGTVTITWTASTSDPAYFSLELVNDAFHDTFAIANNVQTALGTLTIQLPQVPVQGGYSLEAIATNDINQVLSQSGTFSIGGASSSSSTGASSSSTAATTASSSSGSLTASTASVTATTPASSASGTGTASASATPSAFTSSGAASFKLAGVAPAAALVLSAVAGAAMVF